ncbi:hypothetical protein MRB53_003562 [Persea americana]|uniref:Uncharacterized protein n=1 Tax=Persea americana TaxID=3435 RepID=A0ACC2MXV2_PERAE|nr:hypothetical protein MRB53_003562 [Persea americana]
MFLTNLATIQNHISKLWETCAIGKERIHTKERIEREREREREKGLNPFLSSISLSQIRFSIDFISNDGLIDC